MVSLQHGQEFLTTVTDADGNRFVSTDPGDGTALLYLPGPEPDAAPIPVLTQRPRSESIARTGISGRLLRAAQGALSAPRE